MMHKLLVFGITCMILGVANTMNIFLLITSNGSRTGSKQKQPSIANQPQQEEQQSPNQREQQQQQQQLLQQLTNRPQLNQTKGSNNSC